jgi:hypothetical protein
MNKQIKLTVLAIAVILSSFISACGTDSTVKNPADMLLAPAGQVQNDVTEFLQGTCPQRADGTCKTMGE